jgi:hypothetical protein
LLRLSITALRSATWASQRELTRSAKDIVLDETLERTCSASRGLGSTTRDVYAQTYLRKLYLRAQLRVTLTQANARARVCIAPSQLRTQRQDCTGLLSRDHSQRAGDKGWQRCV